MSKAKITKAGGYDCAPLGHTIVNFPVDTIVADKVAEWALSDNAASRMFNPVEAKKIVAPPETKRKKRK